MRITVRNPATQQLEQVTAEGSKLFVRFVACEAHGEALISTQRFLEVSLDSLCELISERLAVLELADKPKPKPKKVAA